MAPTHPKNLEIQVSDAPTPIYEDSLTIDYSIKENHFTIIVKNMALPIY